MNRQNNINTEDSLAFILDGEIYFEGFIDSNWDFDPDNFGGVILSNDDENEQNKQDEQNDNNTGTAEPLLLVKWSILKERKSHMKLILHSKLYLQSQHLVKLKHCIHILNSFYWWNDCFSSKVN